MDEMDDMDRMDEMDKAAALARDQVVRRRFSERTR
jgi:hypothetical protein